MDAHDEPRRPVDPGERDAPLPDGLARRFSAPGPVAGIPGAVDGAILMAAGRIAFRRRWRRRMLDTALPAAAAAALVAGLLFWHGGRPAAETDAGPEEKRMADAVGAERPLDVVDALRLRLALDRAGLAGAGRDVDGDGVVDEADVAALLARIVRLPEGQG